MRHAHSHKMGAEPDESTVLDTVHAPTRPTLVAETSLEAALARLARGEAGGAEAVLGWHGGRIEATLLRMLGDPALVELAVDRLLADVPHYPSAVEAADVTAEDWLFARLRLHVRELQQPAGAQQLGTASPAMASSQSAPPASAGEPVVDLGPPTLYPRLRRPGAPVHGQPVTTPLPARRARWPRLVMILLAWLAAGGAGFATLAWLAGDRPPAPSLPPAAMTAPPAPAPAASEAPAPPSPAPATSEAPAPAPPSARELLGEPITDREPPVTVLPRQLSSADEPALAPPATPRIVVHHRAGSESGASLARSVAAALGDNGLGSVEIRPVPMSIVGATVRFFHAEDRAAAERALAATRPLLTAAGRAAPVTPLDFSDYIPSPRPGTLEIWVPG
jgi:hypothetical protein